MIQTRRLFPVIVFSLGIILGLSLMAFNKVLLSRGKLYAETNTLSTNAAGKPAEDDNYFKYFAIFRQAYDVFKHEFYDGNKVSARNLFYGAMKGMLESAGASYSVFMEPSAAREFGNDINANFVGLGINIDIRDGYLTVISPIDGSPAAKAGIKAGDRIIYIEGKSTKNITSEEAIQKLRGLKGSVVTITISREGIRDPINFTIKREQIQVKTVNTAMIPYMGTNYGYIRVKEFSVPTAREFKTALYSIISNKPGGFIVDLRNNPGGLLEAAVEMVNYFVDGGLIVYTRGRLQENNQDYFASKEGVIVPLSLPVVVLINRGSASASEIFTGAMMDDQRAVIAGEKSFGKGSVQKTYAFSEDGSAIKYTVAKYFTPSGKSIDKVGIVPDVAVDLWYEALSEKEKNDFVKAESTNIVSDYLRSRKLDGTAREELKNYLSGLGFVLSRKSIDYLIETYKYSFSEPPVYDLDFDDQLDKALDVLKNYQSYARHYKNFKEAAAAVSE